MRNKVIKIVFLILTILTTIFIWSNSLLPAKISSKESNFILKTLKPLFSLFMPAEKITSHFIRKLAHFSEFFILGVFTATAMTKHYLSFPITLMIAVTDETIQFISAGRAPMIKDVLLDFCGACIAIIITLIFKTILFAKTKHNIIK